MKKYIFLYLILSTFFSFSQNYEIEWQECYGGSGNEYASSIVPTDNGYLIFGVTQSDDGNVSNNNGDSDIWIVSIDSTGNILWERCYGGSGTEIPNNIIKVDDNYYFGAWTASNDGDIQSGNHGGYDRWIVNIDNMGDIIWEKCFGGSGTEYGGNIKLLNNGNIIVYAASTSSDGDVPINYGFLDVWLLIISPVGEIINNKVLGNIWHNNVFDIIETNDFGFFMASTAEIEEGMVIGNFHGGTDVWAVKLDSILNIKWQKLYGGSNDDYSDRGVLELEDGYLFLSSTNSYDGDVTGFHGGFADIWAVRIDTIGNIIWQRCLGGTGSDWPGTLHQSDDSGFVIVGETSSNDGNVSGNNSWQGNSDIWMLKLSSEGDLEWQECYGGYGNERIYKGVFRKSENNWVLAGRASNNSFDVNCDLYGYEDFWVFEIKDCDYYAAATPATPQGADTVCTVENSQTAFTIPPADRALSYEWNISPDEAGTISGDSITGTVTWSQDFEGTATVTVRSVNYCGESNWSQPYFVQVYSCIGIPEQEKNGVTLKVYPNPAKDYAVFEIKGLKGNGNILIMNIFGETVATERATHEKTVVKLRGLDSGLYYYRVDNDVNVLSGKIVVWK